MEKVSPEDGRNIPSVSREALKGEYRLLLTADGAVAEKLAERVAHLAKRVKVTARGVMVITDRLSRVLELPLYQEAWFVARLRKGVRADRVAPGRGCGILGTVCDSGALLSAGETVYLSSAPSGGGGGAAPGRFSSETG